MRYLRFVIICFIVFVSFQKVSSQAWFDGKSRAWADTLMKVMTLDEKIGQLFMVPVFPDKDQKHYDKIVDLVKTYNIGGVIYFKSGPVKQALMTNMLQSYSRIPLFVSLDAEWGLIMRMDSTMQFPLQMTLGAIQDKSLIYEMGQSMAHQCKRMGIHISFSPVADINNNPKNPIINLRSFGDSKTEVTERAYQYMKGLQDGGMIAVLKHFPGHGDTHTDSHKDLPVLDFDRKRLDSLELYPFRELIKRGATGVMVAHLFVPELDKTKNTATTLSRSVVTDLLKNELGFKGLVFTDALNMKGVAKFNKPGEVDLKALLAGNDVLVYTEDVPKAVELIRNAILVDSTLSLAELEEHTRKILMAKYYAGLNSYSPVDLTNLHNDLFKAEDIWINRKLAENAVTLVRNNDEILPLQNLDTLRIACVSLGMRTEYDFWKSLGEYVVADTFSIDKSANKLYYDSMQNLLSSYNLVILSISQTNRYNYNSFSFPEEAVNFINTLPTKQKTILVLFSSPYSLSVLTNPLSFQSIVMAYEPLSTLQEFAAQGIAGGIGFKGKLPVNVTSLFERGFGLETKPIRLKYTCPEEIGLTALSLASVDTLIANAIEEKMFPGCQVWVSYKDKVIFNKSYGYLTYDQTEPVTNEHLYDIASLTKIMASAPALMKMYDDNKLTPETQVSDLLKETQGTNVGQLKMGDIMSHQAGLKAWIPFFKAYVKTEPLREKYFTKTPDSIHQIHVADSMYASIGLIDSVYHRIYNSDISNKKTYLYSDMGMYLVPKIIQESYHQSLDEFLKTKYYSKLGLTKMLYHPLDKYPIALIAPTENDTSFRKQVIRGYVHDQGAALIGGMSGHAGLFANASSVGVMMNLYLNGGSYGGAEILKRETVTQFTSCYNCPTNRRGLIFDKPMFGHDQGKRITSPLSFGHSGFTGTYAWADPKTEIVYVFLSNRVYPDAENKKIQDAGIRTKILEIFTNKIKEAEANK
ncbi:MAG: hypothetical protein CVU05_01425 [Bacteroidetes bacterium HGW-Bacteroidetes-21]|jgi:beta-glucosidase-like glycosyl hydrolase/CubicO group peptidase (beta-lactamase class C family)|nr:MAG: hypothetical protein CVU05_01425 [Bacteroidetes bacterium HGW-Bacteroidetes-21]